MSNLCLASAKYEAGLIICVEDLFFEIFNLLLKSTMLAAAGPKTCGFMAQFEVTTLLTALNANHST